jgi:transposase
VWTNENRGRYDRSRLRYPSDLTDEEWALVEPLIPPAKRGGNRRTVSVREVLNGLMYVLSTGCQWRAIPKDRRRARRSTIVSICGDAKGHRQFRQQRRVLRRHREGGRTVTIGGALTNSGTLQIGPAANEEEQ